MTDQSVPSLIIPAFIAGLLTFLAPCTFPLIPAYISFISGVSQDDLNDENKKAKIRRKVLVNGLMYVLGFSFVFILLGSIFGLVGSVFASYQVWITRIGGVLVIFFGLYMMGLWKLSFLKKLMKEKKLDVTSRLKPGTPTSSLLFGAALGLGWTPCIGPILGSILILASAQGTVYQGILLLLIYSIGLAIPFMLVALGIGSAAKRMKKLNKYLPIVSVIGGIFLVIVGIFLVQNQFSQFIAYFYTILAFINFDGLNNHL